MRLQGIVLDVGGVFLLPNGRLLAPGLEGARIPFVPMFERAHYVAVAAYDAAKESSDEVDHWGAYVGGYVRGLEVPEPEHQRAYAQLRPMWGAPAVDLWSSPVTDSVTDLLALSRYRVPIAIVSNSDGSVEEELRRHGICQVGEGTGVPVSAVVDSAVVGISKPDPAIFDYALKPMDLRAEEVGYIGDSVANDVNGATNAGMVPFHFDPFALCHDRSHRHLSRVAEVLAWF